MRCPHSAIELVNFTKKVEHHMTLIKSISGMRGTIGGAPGDNLTPIDIVEFTSAYAQMLISQGAAKSVVVGRDGRITGPNVQALVCQTLVMMGIDVIDTDLSTTPTVEVAVPYHNAGGGIIITASHNPKQWNALKFLNHKGEFISHEAGQELLEIAANRQYQYADVDAQGKITKDTESISRHIDEILALDLVDSDLVAAQKKHVIVDCVNSTGAISIAPLLDRLGCTYELLNAEITGDFAHNPEPLAKNLTDLCQRVKESNAALGIAVDPDVDRLAFVDNEGNYCGEEYTLVMVAQWILENNPGATVSNLSSTIVLRQITEAAGQSYEAAAVGEVNVVNKMKAINAVIGGEGNGGIIYPALHYGRDALVGIALLMTALSKKGVSLAEYRATFANYIISKSKIDLTEGINADSILAEVEKLYTSTHEIDTQDGVKIYMPEGWVHLRKSNTEPIIRLYAEAPNAETAEKMSRQLMGEIEKLA